MLVWPCDIACASKATKEQPHHTPLRHGYYGLTPALLSYVQLN